MTKNGPRTSTRISRGWRMISVSSLLRNEEMRMRNLKGRLIGTLLFDQAHKHIVEGRQDFLDRFDGDPFSLTGFHQLRHRGAGFVDDDFDLLIADLFDLAAHERQTLEV